DVVARVVRDRIDRARFLAGVAPDADLRVDQMLPQHVDNSAHANLTSSKSIACLLMPIGGGAIQPANLPGAVTRPMSNATNARSSGVGSHSRSCAFHSASSPTRPSGA